jgi:hypothetical protein
MADSPLVHLVSVGSDAEAAILRSYLEAHGIYCYTQGENHRSMLGFLGPHIELNLMVPEADLDQARLLLQEYEAAAPEPASEERDEQDEKGDPGGGEIDTGHERRHRALRRLRVARICGLLFPVGLVHLLVGAPVRGVIMMAVCVGAWYMAMSNPPWALLIPVAIIVDIIGAGQYVHGRLDEQKGTSTRD